MANLTEIEYSFVFYNWLLILICVFLLNNTGCTRATRRCILQLDYFYMVLSVSKVGLIKIDEFIFRLINTQGWVMEFKDICPFKFLPI